MRYLRNSVRSVLYTGAVICGVCAALAVSGCASADKRFQQGSELELQGQYEQAAARYVQALEKDATLAEARSRLRQVGDLAVAERMADANASISRGDPLGAAPHLRRVDSVTARARSVGVSLTLPHDFAERRRGVFDDAIDLLIDQGLAAVEQGRWQDGLAAYQRALRDFEPSTGQRQDLLTEEAALYIQWSDREYQRGHLRNAFDIVARVHQMEWVPTELAERADDDMDLYLDEGELAVISLPVQTLNFRRRGAEQERDLAGQLESSLRQGPWRLPPAFVRLHEGPAVRDLLSGSGLLEGEYRSSKLALVARLAETDFAAFLQVTGLEETEFDLQTKSENVKTREGRQTTFVREEGQLRLQASVRVVIADGFGNEIADVVVVGTGTAPFARGVYDGEPRELNLNSRQIDLFDRHRLEDQARLAQDDVVRDLTIGIADVVFDAVLSRVP